MALQKRQGDKTSGLSDPLGTFGSLNEDDLAGKAPPSPRVVDWFHGKVSTTKPTDIHHHLGFSPGNASPGDHTHDGKTSLPLWDETTDVVNNLPTSPTVTQISASFNQLLGILRTKGIGGA